MRIKFIDEARIDDKVAFENESEHELNDDSANRWIRRGKAVKIESKLNDIKDAVKEKAKDLAHAAADKINEIADGKPESDKAEHKEGDKVANPADSSENGKKANSAHQAPKAVKGL